LSVGTGKGVLVGVRVSVGRGCLVFDSGGAPVNVVTGFSGELTSMAVGIGAAELQAVKKRVRHPRAITVFM
jgi:hypothetical protein